MRITLSSDVDDIVLSNGVRQDRQEFWIVAGGIEGLYGATAVRETGTPIPQQDGDYWPSRLTHEGRTITLKIATYPSSSIAMAKAVRRVDDLSGRHLVMHVEDEFGYCSLGCYLTNDVSPTIIFSRDYTTFTLILYCPDPLKYGREAAYSPVLPWLDVENTGLAASWPRVRVDGPVSLLRVRSDDGLVEWQGDADGLDLDFADMQPSSGRVTVGRPWRVRPGMSRYWVDMDGAGDMRMIVRPAWR